MQKTISFFTILILITNIHAGDAAAPVSQERLKCEVIDPKDYASEPKNPFAVRVAQGAKEEMVQAPPFPTTAISFKDIFRWGVVHGKSHVRGTISAKNKNGDTWQLQLCKDANGIIVKCTHIIIPPDGLKMIMFKGCDPRYSQNPCPAVCQACKTLPTRFDIFNEASQ